VPPLSVDAGAKLLGSIGPPTGPQKAVRPILRIGGREQPPRSGLQAAVRWAGNEPAAIIWLATQAHAEFGSVLNITKNQNRFSIQEIPDHGAARLGRSSDNRSVLTLSRWLQRIHEGALDSQSIHHKKAVEHEQALRIISVFSSAPTLKEVNWLLTPQGRVPGVSDKLTPRTFQSAFAELVDLRLCRRAGPDGVYDGFHPLVRRLASQRLAADDRAVWQNANEMLANCYRRRAKNENRLSRLRRLMNAISHGCRAGTKQIEDALKTYKLLVKDTGDRDSWKQIASRSEDLAVLSNFFESPFGDLREGLDPDGQRTILNEAGYDLQKQCHYADAARLLERAFHISSHHGTSPDAKLAIRDGVMWAKCLVAQLKFDSAYRIAADLEKKFVPMLELTDNAANNKGVYLRRMFAHALRGQLHHLCGEAKDAEEKFSHVLSAQQDAADWVNGIRYSPKLRAYAQMLSTQRVFDHVLFLIDAARADEEAARADAEAARANEEKAERRIAKAMDLLCEAEEACDAEAARKGPESVGDHRAFNLLAIAQLRLAEYERSSSSEKLDESQQLIRRAHQEFIKYDLLDGWCLSLLVLSDCARHRGELEAARRYANEALQFAQGKGAKRFEIEAQLRRIKCDALSLPSRPRRYDKQVRAFRKECAAVVESLPKGTKFQPLRSRFSRLRELAAKLSS
jgi:hypothetical protein